MRRLFSMGALVASGACFGHRDRPVTIVAPSGDSVLTRYMPARASYVCRTTLLYERTGPKVQSCVRQGGDTTYLIDRLKSGRIVAVGWELMVPINVLDDVTAAVEDSLAAQYGTGDTCVPGAATLRRWRWWAAGDYTVQARMVDPTSVYRVSRGRLEVQAIPSSATVCITWLHTPHS